MKTSNVAAWERLGILTMAVCALLPLLPFAIVGLGS